MVASRQGTTERYARDEEAGSHDKGARRPSPWRRASRGEVLRAVGERSRGTRVLGRGWACVASRGSWAAEHQRPARGAGRASGKAHRERDELQMEADPGNGGHVQA
jgi:hypothetical protein|uniref:Uncharacterized protein n=1 Tax=Zea mays TaxID=4577 RepID=A0A804PUP3_MAIZE